MGRSPASARGVVVAVSSLRELDNQKLRELSWTVYGDGDAYGKRISPVSELFLFREHEILFTVWRGTWKKGISRPTSKATIAERLTIDQAVSCAERYLNLINRKRVKNDEQGQ